MRREATLGFIVVSLAATGALFAGCASFEADICAYAKCDADGSTADGPTPSEGGPDATTPDGDVPPVGCESLNEPLKNPEKCFTNENWAYVKDGGDDLGPGTKDKPFGTIGKALTTGKLRIAVCSGTYLESVEVKRDVTIQSGFACDFTKAAAKGKVVALKPDYAVKIEKPAANVALRDIEVEAAEGTAASVNSVAIVVNEVARMTLIGVTVTAKNGFNGPAGAGGTTGVVSNLAAIGGTVNGYPATGNTTPGPLKSCTCAIGGITAGGGGGAPTGGGQPGTPSLGGGAAGEGATNCGAGGSGVTGGGGAAGDAAARAQVIGSFNQAVWAAGVGLPGEDGKSGQGGGGGGGRDASSAGGGGGCGGCGGSGGKGGGGGGASIAVVSIASVTKLEACTLKSGAGGTGGTGGIGGTGGAGGGGGNGGGSGCMGGEGGMGGMGGAGGGGAGGISYGIVYKGTKPDRDRTTVTPGSGGKGGTNGDGVAEHGPAGTFGEELNAN